MKLWLAYAAGTVAGIVVAWLVWIVVDLDEREQREARKP